MIYRVKVSGTEHIDDHHGKTYMTDIGNQETVWEIIDSMVERAGRMGWTGIKVEYQATNEAPDSWHNVII